VPLVEILADDPVPNIRINVAKAIVPLAPLTQAAGLAKLKAAEQKMTNDGDRDVRYFAGVGLGALQNVQPHA
jgi:hypothetical protein